MGLGIDRSLHKGGPASKYQSLGLSDDPPWMRHEYVPYMMNDVGAAPVAQQPLGQLL